MMMMLTAMLRQPSRKYTRIYQIMCDGLSHITHVEYYLSLSKAGCAMKNVTYTRLIKTKQKRIMR